jgi:murein L,D-transpeptidase YcbB/YkuD
VFQQTCLGLEDAERLAERLAGVSAGPGVHELREPVPVYVTYFTLMPRPSRLERRADVYGLDPPLLAQLGQGPRTAG